MSGSATSGGRPGARGWGLVLALALLASEISIPVVSGFSRTESAADDAVKTQLAGEWTLVKYEIFPESGPARPGNYDIGRINYGEHEMSAHLMRSGRPKEAASTEA